jgi:hypothetical protein
MARTKARHPNQPSIRPSLTTWQWTPAAAAACRILPEASLPVICALVGHGESTAAFSAPPAIPTFSFEEDLDDFLAKEALDMLVMDDGSADILQVWNCNFCGAAFGDHVDAVYHERHECNLAPDDVGAWMHTVLEQRRVLSTGLTEQQPHATNNEQHLFLRELNRTINNYAVRP